MSRRRAGRLTFKLVGCLAFLAITYAATSHVFDGPVTPIKFALTACAVLLAAGVMWVWGASHLSTAVPEPELEEMIDLKKKGKR